MQEFPFHQVHAISGSAQQHGTVYWRCGARTTLSHLDIATWKKNSIEIFSLSNGPIWMDSSTTRECQKLERHMDGPLQLSQLTGSRAYERFSGPQIAKIYQDFPHIYHATERISLVRDS